MKHEMEFKDLTKNLKKIFFFIVQNVCVKWRCGQNKNDFKSTEHSSIIWLEIRSSILLV